MTLKCIIVDDEPLQQEILRDYAAEIPGIELAGNFSNGTEAFNFLKNNKVDLIFLDINMPGMNGIELVNRLINPPQVIFTTAYPEYAVEGFNLNAVDYLLKPISFGRFLKAIEKFQHASRLLKADVEDSILVKSGKKEYLIKTATIIYIESMGDYVRMVTETQSIITHGTLVQFLSLLPSDQFFRIHKSFIINLEKIDYFEGNCISLSGKKFPIGRSFHEGFLECWRANKKGTL
jgi:DNA-binding LytR/AlgR family response regulator